MSELVLTVDPRPGLVLTVAAVELRVGAAGGVISSNVGSKAATLTIRSKPATLALD